MIRQMALQRSTNQIIRFGLTSAAAVYARWHKLLILQQKNSGLPISDVAMLITYLQGYCHWPWCLVMHVLKDKPWVLDPGLGFEGQTLVLILAMRPCTCLSINWNPLTYFILSSVLLLTDVSEKHCPLHWSLNVLITSKFDSLLPTVPWFWPWAFIPY